MLPYGFALLVILTMLCKFTLTSSEMSFSEDKAKAYANNFASYAMAFNTAANDGWTWDDNTDREVMENNSLSTYRKGFQKMANWKAITDPDGGHCYVFANPTDMPINAHGAFELAVMDIMDNSAAVGRLAYNSANAENQRYYLERYARSTTKTVFYIPDSFCGAESNKMHQGAMVYVMTYNTKS